MPASKLKSLPEAPTKWKDENGVISVWSVDPARPEKEILRFARTNWLWLLLATVGTLGAILPGLFVVLLIYWATERLRVPLFPHLRVTADGVKWKGGEFKPSQFHVIGTPEDGRMKVVADSLTLLDHRPTREGPGSPPDLAKLTERIQDRLAIALETPRALLAWELWAENDDLHSAGDVRRWVAQSKRTYPTTWQQPLEDPGTYTHDGVSYRFRHQFHLTKTTLTVSGIEFPLAALLEIHSIHWLQEGVARSCILLVHRTGRIDRLNLGGAKPGRVRHAAATMQAALQALAPADGGTAQDVPDSLRQMRAKESSQQG